MKNLYTVLLLVAFVTSMSAQIHKGSILLGGSVGFNNTMLKGSSSTDIHISPTAGFFLSDRFVLGSSLGYSFSLFTDGSTASTIGMIPFARYYFNGSGTARLFGEANVGFQVDAGFNGDPIAIFGLGFGVDFFLNDNVAIEGSLGYQRFQDPETFGGGFNNIGLNFGVAAFVGGGKKE